ncbi:hypothetical protein NEMIN01_0589 [Nematocida minor]|uniref:uncharacterized protein n=1 Tax=Nematocida minor TaxID=1912983 RepID=UPI00221FEBC7|nr:uncharacterized protein NEMIN01_0589 [Nematocida minor]KAI5189636.1 hypothetical protein NEMIN01_0589 [Nematocida minor]
MGIVYIPVLKKNGVSMFDESLPSPLFGRVTEEEWKEILAYLNKALFKRRNRSVFKLLAPFIIGNIFRAIAHSYVDRKVKNYLDKKNLMLSHCGVHIHHPAERMYSGLDVSIYTVAGSPFNM